jgi:cell pole-organizing protein PopZ
MSNAQPEPSMEEILASIRRIISEDEEEAPAKPVARSEPIRPPEPPARPAPAIRPPQPAVAREEPDQKFATEDVEMIRKNVAESMDDEDSMIEAATAAAASRAFLSLSESVQISKGEGRTLEDIVVEMLKPMIKDWLDTNLAQIVEEKVEEEVQRVARRRR